MYLFWFGDNEPEAETPNSSSSDKYSHEVAGILGDVTLRTGGEIVYMSSDSIHPNGEIGTVKRTHSTKQAMT